MALVDAGKINPGIEEIGIGCVRNETDAWLPDIGEKEHAVQVRRCYCLPVTSTTVCMSQLLFALN